MDVLLDIVKNEYIKYSEKPVILQKLKEIINNLTENLLDFQNENEKNRDKSSDIAKNVMGFLNNPDHQYFYIKSTELFIHYNNEHFSVINEDDIWHFIYTYLKGKPTDIKTQTKNAIIEYIKNTCIFQLIPESKTIQNVINFLYPSIFTSKEEAKYFLSVLGDNIFKKDKSIIHYFNIKSKSFMTCLHDNLYDKFAASISINNTIKWRYHQNHVFSNCRILKFNKAVLSSHCWQKFLRENIVDVLSVAGHYSGRYNGSENYLNNHLLDSKIKNHILYLKGKTDEIIVDEFIDSEFKYSLTQININWDTVYFVWKMYLKEKHYPNILFSQTLKNLINAKIDYDEENDTYNNIYGESFAKIINLQTFWKETITDVKLSGDDCFLFSDYEIGEICNLYRQWLNNDNASLLIDQETMQTMIEFFYPKVIIVENKYIKNIQCKLWLKHTDVLRWLKHYKKDKTKTFFTSVSISKLYQNYCEFKKQNMQNNSVSKNYFTKFLNITIPKQYLNKNLVQSNFFHI